MTTIAYMRQETYAFEKHYYELVSYPSPVEFLFSSFERSMKSINKSMFKVPAEYSKIGKDIIFVFDILDHGDCSVYLYKCAVADKKVIREFNPNEDYSR